jgi:hypothetical protein
MIRAAHLAAAFSIMVAPVFAQTVTSDDVDSALEGVLSSRNMFSGEELFRLRDQMTPFFVGYVTAVVDAGSLSVATRRYCMPAAVKNMQMADVVYKYLGDNPRFRHLGAAYLVRESLHQTWPCPSQQR